ncbi:MAG: cytochrome d ubiquinol oxidase subunit II, partial [Gemmatimonadales bacterium]
AFAVLWLVATLDSRIAIPRLWQAYAQPWTWVAPVLFVIAAAEFRVLVGGKRPGRAFAHFSMAIAMLLAIMGQGLYPDLVPALGTGESLTVTNASSTPLTLQVMLTIALIGMPFVIGYTIFIYRRFKGPVKLDEHSY